MTSGIRILGLALVATLASHLPARAAAIVGDGSTTSTVVGVLPDLQKGGMIQLTSSAGVYPTFDYNGIGQNVYTFDGDATIRLAFDGSGIKALADAGANDLTVDITAHVKGYHGIGSGEGYTESGDKESWGTFTGTVSSVNVVSDDPAKVPAELLALAAHPERITLDSPMFRGAPGSLPPIFVTIAPAPVPEPATLVILALGSAAFGLRAAHRRRKARAIVAG